MDMMSEIEVVRFDKNTLLPADGFCDAMESRMASGDSEQRLMVDVVRTLYDNIIDSTPSHCLLYSSWNYEDAERSIWKVLLDAKFNIELLAMLVRAVSDDHTEIIIEDCVNPLIFAEHSKEDYLGEWVETPENAQYVFYDDKFVVGVNVVGFNRPDRHAVYLYIYQFKNPKN